MCFPDEILERIFDFLSLHQDRNSVSLVCKTWFDVERWSRHRVFVGNCYAVGPKRVIERFPRLGSLSLKGRPHFYGLPHDWGGSAQGWIAALAESCPCLEELKLKRMVVSDDSLALLSRSFPNFKALVLFGCWGFTTDGLAAIAANCRILRELDLQESKVDDHGGNWISCFPDSFTSLVSLNISACLGGEVNFGTLERLVARCPDLRSLRLNVTVSLQALLRILAQAPRLEDLGTGTFVDHQPLLPIDDFLQCNFVKSLSGYWGITPNLLGFIHTMCSNNLTSLNLSYAPAIEGFRFIKLIEKCCKLERLWVLDCIGDKGLRAVSSNCKELQELRVFPSNRFFPRRNAASAVTEDGLVSVSDGCPKLHSLLYFCRQMTNASLFTVARNCPHLTHFRLCIQYPRKADPVMHQPLDEGFGAIVRSCKQLKRLSLSGLLTDQVFLYIGMYAEQLEMLSVAFAGGSDNGMIYVLNGCKKLRKLEIRDCRFGDSALLTDVGKYERMRSLWMSSCDITLRGCKLLAQKMPRLNVEIINDRNLGGLNFKDENPVDDDRKVQKMYLYRTLDGPRKDVPHYVWTL